MKYNPLMIFRDLSLDGLYIANCLKLSVPVTESIAISEDVREFMEVKEEDLEDRMDVDIWTRKVNTMGEVTLKECPYNMQELLGK